MPKYFSPIIENAIRIANYWHQGQMRKGKEFDYFTHPVAVANILSKAGFDNKVVAAGYCHDLLEDTDCPPEEIATACGVGVLEIVRAVSDDFGLDLNKDWEERKRRYIEKVRLAGPLAKAVCTADKIHNLATLITALKEYGMPYFANFHRGPEEKLWFEDHVCMMLQDTWDHPLIKEYNDLIDNFVELLEKLDLESGKEYDALVSQSRETTDFDVPEIVETTGEEISNNQALDKNQENDLKRQKLKEIIEMRPQVSDHTIISWRVKENNKEQKKAKYLKKEELNLLMPAVLQLGISKGVLSSRLLIKNLKINYLMSFRILKELKRLHIIKRVDGVTPQKLNVVLAKKLLNETVSD